MSPADLFSPKPKVEGTSLHLVSFVTACLDMLQRLEDWCLAKNYGKEAVYVLESSLHSTESYFFCGFEQWSWYLIPAPTGCRGTRTAPPPNWPKRKGGGRGSIQFCLVLARLSLRLSKCSRICSRVSWANLLLELLRLHGKAESQILSTPPVSLLRSETVLSDSAGEDSRGCFVGLRNGGPACHMSLDYQMSPQTNLV